MTAADLLVVLGQRFEKNMSRHPGLSWSEVESRLSADSAPLSTLLWMEQTGGEPDVTSREDSGAFVFTDCCAESPADRRSLCYDQKAWEGRKEHRPQGSALATAEQAGAEVLDEDQYRALQALGEFDKKTSSWLRTPEAMRSQGGALFGDRRYGRVFTYHNGADSYYGVRGFRTRVVV